MDGWVMDAAATGMSRGWWVGMGDCTVRGTGGGGGWLPRSVDRSVVACSAVSCLDRACSYSRLQCDKRRMRPSPSLSPPRSAGPAHGRTRSKLLSLPPKSGVSPLPPPLLAPDPMLQIENHHHRQRCNTNSAAGVTLHTPRALTCSLATRKKKRGKAVCLH